MGGNIVSFGGGFFDFWEGGDRSRVFGACNWERGVGRRSWRKGI